MSTAATLLSTDKTRVDEGAERGGLTRLHLHWAGVAALVIVNIYLLARLGMLWHDAGTHNADAIARQRLADKAAAAAAEPLRGADAKVAQSTADADRFYRERLPQVQSQVLAELGELQKKNNVRLTRVTYPVAQVLAGTPNELTELKMDASLSGDYRPLMQFLNALERDRMFFMIDGVTLTGQQGGMVNLRLRLTTYLRGGTGTISTEGAGSSAAPAGGVR